jgi:chaperonin GroES
VIKPLGDRVILKVEKEEEKTIGGIVLASAAQEKSQIATIVAVGPGKTLKDKVVGPNVVAGQRVIFEKFSGIEVKIDGEEYLVVHEEDLVGIIE